MQAEFLAAQEAEAARVAAEEQQTKRRRQEALEAAEREREATAKAAAEAQAALAAKQAEADRIKKEQDALMVQERQRRIQQELNEALTDEVPFRKNSGIMTDAGPRVLEGVTKVLEKYPFVTILVDGHAGGDKNTPFLQKLSEKRALTVKDELRRQGIEDKRIVARGSGAKGRGGHVFITVHRMNLKQVDFLAATYNDLAPGQAGPQRSFAQLVDNELTPEQVEKKAKLDQKVRMLRNKMKVMMAAKAAAAGELPEL